MNLIEVENLIIDTANCILGDINTKQKVKFYLMDLMTKCCIEYSRNNVFKKQVDGYITYKQRL